MKTTRAIVMSLLGTSLILSVPARAGSVEITYNFIGALTAPPVVSGGFLVLQGADTGSVDQFNPAINTIWNPVSWVDTTKLDLSTGLSNGTFTWTFANGETLSGTMFEDLTMLDTTTGIGPFTQILTFTNGTGEFADVTGSTAGDGFGNGPTFTSSASGFLTAPGLISAAVPEPVALSIFGAGLAGAAAMRRRKAKSA